jgi:hypothetical protein
MPGGVSPPSPDGSPQQSLAKARLSGPATQLRMLSILHIAVAIMAFFLIIFLIIAAGPHGWALALVVIIELLPFLLIGLVVPIVVLLGTIRMEKLQSYGFAMTAAILSIIPCTSPCCFLIGTPIGIWALWVLTDPDVKNAFH